MKTNARKHNKPPDELLSRYQRLVEAAGDVIYSTDMNGHVDYINASVERLFGYSPDQVIGRHFSTFVHPDWRQKVIDHYVQQFNTRQPETIYEFPILTASGEAHWVEQVVIAVIENDRVTGFNGFMRDISRRRQVEEQLGEQGRLFRAIIENASDSVFVKDREGRYLLVNPAFARVMGQAVDELIGKTDHQLMDKDEADYFNQTDQEVVAGREARRYEDHATYEDGERYFSTLKFPLMADDGRVQGVVGIVRDITEDKRIEQELRQSQQRYHDLFEQIEDAITIHDDEANILEVNEAACRRLGYSREELLRMKTTDIDAPDYAAGFKDRLARQFADGKLGNISGVHITKDGQRILIDVNSRAITYRGKPAVLAVVRDITQIRRNEESSQTFLNYLKALNEINIELSRVETVDGLCRRAIEVGRDYLNFDRLGLFLLDESGETVYGTFGTDASGQLRDERHIKLPATRIFDWLMNALHDRQRVAIWQDAPLYDNWQIVGQGWNALATLWDNNRVIGWLAADNLIHQKPLENYQPELLGLFGGSLEKLIVRKRAEEWLRRSEERYRMIVEDQTELICRWRADTTLTFVNDAYCRAFDKTRVELEDVSFLTMVPENYHGGIRAQIERALKTGEIISYEHPVVLKGGRIRWQEWTDRPLFDAEGKFLEFQSVGRDITERRLAENERNDYIHRLEIIQNVDTALMEQLNVDYVVDIALKAAVSISQADAGAIHFLEGDQLRVAQSIGNYPASMIGTKLPLTQGIVGRVARRRLPELVPDVTHDPDYVHNVIETRAQMTLPLLTQNQLIGVLNVQTAQPDRFTPQMFDFLKVLAARIASALENAQLHHTTEKQLTELQELYRQVSELEQLKTQMIRIAAHDLRNPLGVISGYVQMLNMEVGAQLPERNRGHLGIIGESVNRIDKITRDILTLERISAGRELQSESLDLCQLVTRAFQELQAQAAQKLIDYQLQPAPVAVNIVGDRYLLPETLTNLIGNAIKYTPNSGRICVKLYTEPSLAVFEVEDSGFGIPLDEQGKLFEPFFRVRTKETNDIPGTGLGLHLVKAIVERHGGKMRFRSEYGQGSLFGFELPLIVARPKATRKRPRVART